MEGESFLIRCHSWKNLRLTKVTYYKDGIPIRYWYENFNISISNVTTKNSGNYSCSGQIQQKGYTSKVLNIIVKKGELVKKEGGQWPGKGERGPLGLERRGVVALPHGSPGPREGPGPRPPRPCLFAGSGDTCSSCGIFMKTKCGIWKWMRSLLSAAQA